MDYEQKKEKSTSPVEHEKGWEKHDELRQILNDTRMLLINYAEILAQMADIQAIVIK